MVSPSHLGPILAVYFFRTTTSSLPAPQTPPSAPLSSGLLRIHLFREVVAHARHRSTSNSPPNPSSSLQEPANPRLTHRINTSVPPSDPPTSSRPDPLLVFFLASADPGRSSNFKLVRGRGRRGRGPRAPACMRLRTDRRSTGTSTPLSGGGSTWSRSAAECYRGFCGTGTPSCLQIPRTRPGPISRCRGTKDREPVLEFSHASCGPLRLGI